MNLNKMMRYLQICILFLLLLGCSKSENFDTISTQQLLYPGLNVESSYLKNQSVILNFLDDSGENINSSTNYIVDGEYIQGNAISYQNLGYHEVYAEYIINSQTFTSEIKSFNIVEPVNKVVVEDYTGTWCGYCPPVARAIYELAETTNNITIIGIHNNDELTIDEESDLRAQLGVQGFPSARLNRTISWDSPYDSNQVLNLIQNQNNIGISLDSELSNNQLQVNVRIASKVDLNNHKLVVYLTENNLIYDQANYFNFVAESYFYDLGNPILDYSHQNVLRQTLTNITGDILPEIQALSDFNKKFNVNVYMDYNPLELGLVAIIVDNDNNAINSQFAIINSFQDFN